MRRGAIAVVIPMLYRLVAASARAAVPVAIALVAAAGPIGCAVAKSAGSGAQVVATAEPQPETHRNSTYLVLRLAERRLYVMDDDPETPLESFPIAVGREGLETPLGHFHVEEMVEHPDFVQVAQGVPLRVIRRVPPGPDNPLGERWIGFTHGDGWTIGIHGTPHPELLGRAVSHGCVRMRNPDVIRVYGRIEIGTPVVVEP